MVALVNPGLRAASIFLFIGLAVLHPASGAKTRHFKWAVQYLYWSPDCVENVVIAINGQFPGPTIRARVGDTIAVELTNKLGTEGVVIHWHGIRQVCSKPLYVLLNMIGSNFIQQTQTC